MGEGFFMPKFLIFLLLFSHPHGSRKPETDTSYLQGIDPFAPTGALKSYKSSVIIETKLEGKVVGMGSGNYFKIKRHRFVITALHVIDGAKQIKIIERSGNYVYAKPVLIDKDRDIAVLSINERLMYTKPIQYVRDSKTMINEKIFHCGHPNANLFNLSEGVITNEQKDYYVTNASAWPGSSGSVVFSDGGGVIGVVSSIKLDLPYGLPQLIPYMVRIGKLEDLSAAKILEALEADGF
jgi:S1-C subfamily serine protease